MNQLTTFTFGNTSNVRDLFFFFKINSIVYFTYPSDIKLIPKSNETIDTNGTFIATLPDEFSPVYRFISIMSPYYSTTLQFSIYTDGRVFIYNYGDSIESNWVAARISGIYITK